MYSCQERLTRLRINRHATVFQDHARCPSGRFPQVRTALGHAVQKLGQHLVGRNQPGFSKRLPGADCLRAVLIVWMKCRTPVQRVLEDQPHLFFGAPWR